MPVCTQGCKARRGRRKKKDCENVFLVRAAALIINHNTFLLSPTPTPSHSPFPLIFPSLFLLCVLLLHSCHLFATLSCPYLLSEPSIPSAYLSEFSSLPLSDTCIIAPSGWWLATLIPLCHQEFIYTLIL